MCHYSLCSNEHHASSGMGMSAYHSNPPSPPPTHIPRPFSDLTAREEGVGGVGTMCRVGGTVICGLPTRIPGRRRVQSGTFVVGNTFVNLPKHELMRPALSLLNLYRSELNRLKGLLRFRFIDRGQSIANQHATR